MDHPDMLLDRLEGVKARSNKDQPPTQIEMKLTLHNENLPQYISGQQALI